MYSESNADDGDGALLCESYQTSIDRQFEKLTTNWMNLEDPSQGPSGVDLLVGQNNSGGVGLLGETHPSHQQRPRPQRAHEAR